MADTTTSSPLTEVEVESLDDDKDDGDVLFSERWLNNPVLCCAVCGGGVPLYSVCLFVPQSSETLNRLLLDWFVTYEG